MVVWVVVSEGFGEPPEATEYFEARAYEEYDRAEAAATRMRHLGYRGVRGPMPAPVLAGREAVADKEA